MTGNGKLRAVLEAAMAEHGCTMNDLTVLEKSNDPFRVDTPAGRRDGGWLATLVSELNLDDRTIHLRGLHYAALGRPKPDGTPYANTEKDWLWLSGDAAKAARFLGYIPFDLIVDQRNTPPVVRIFKPPQPKARIHIGFEVDLPSLDDLEPLAVVDDFRGVQPYKLVLIGEKSSLEPELGAFATRHQADLYLPTGEISDTHIYKMAKIGAADGRPMVVLYFSDCDPSGWQMPISVGRKLQAFKAQLFPALDFEVRPVALTPDQVREYDLPSAPMKDTEKRADRWQAAMGVQQTEIDSLVTLRPGVLTQITNEVITPFYDRTLDRRVREAREGWIVEANEIIDAGLDDEERERIRGEAAVRLEELAEEINELKERLSVDPGTIDLPPIPGIPEAEIGGVASNPPLIDSRWDFAEQCRALIDSKAYRNGDGP
jgi:hypothetical protein